MDCQRARDILLLEGDPAAAVRSADGELAQHVGGCADCRAFADRLGRIEAVAAALPGPAEGSAEGRRRTLAQVVALGGDAVPARRRLLLRPALIGAMAAALAVGIGVTAWMWPTVGEQRQTAVVEELIDFDQALADATPQEREQLYAEQAPVLRSAVEQAKWSDEERRLAATVLESPATAQSDPVARAERLGDLSDLIVRQMGPAAAANDDLAVQRLGRRFGRMQRGIGAHLDDKGVVADVSPERGIEQAQRLERMEQVRKRQEEARKRLARLAERSPERAQKALRRMIENAERQRATPATQPKPAKRAAERRDDPQLH